MTFARVTKRQFLLRFGLNDRAFKTLVKEGLIQVATKQGRRPSVTVVGHQLVEGVHYVKCRACSAFMVILTSKHLQACSGVSLDTYMRTYPETSTMCQASSRRRVKTDSQKRRQSRALKVFYGTPQSKKARGKISETSKDPSRLALATENLIRFNKSIEGRTRTSHTSRLLWQSERFRKLQLDWKSQNRDFVLASMSKARGHLSKTSNLHKQVKATLVESGILGFETETQVGFYSIDEADTARKLALEIDGCYWHGCPSCGLEPPIANRGLDARKTTYLNSRGWRVLRVRECDWKRDAAGCLEIIKKEIAYVDSRRS